MSEHYPDPDGNGALHQTAPYHLSSSNADEIRLDASEQQLLASLTAYNALGIDLDNELDIGLDNGLSDIFNNGNVAGEETNRSALDQLQIIADVEGVDGTNDLSEQGTGVQHYSPQKNSNQDFTEAAVETIDLTGEDSLNSRNQPGPARTPVRRKLFTNNPMTPRKTSTGAILTTPSITNDTTNYPLNRKRHRPDSESPSPAFRVQKNRALNGQLRKRSFINPQSLPRKQYTTAVEQLNDGNLWATSGAVNDATLLTPQTAMTYHYMDPPPQQYLQGQNQVFNHNSLQQGTSNMHHNPYTRSAPQPYSQNQVPAVNGNPISPGTSFVQPGSYLISALQPRPQVLPANINHNPFQEDNSGTQGNDEVPHTPRLFSMTAPFRWEKWNEADYKDLSNAIDKTFDYRAFAAATGRFTAEEVQYVLRAAVLRPLRLIKEKYRGEDGMRELAKYFRTHGEPIRRWCLGDTQWTTRGQLMGIKDGHVLVALEAGQNPYPKQSKEGVAMIPMEAIIRNPMDLEYLDETLSDEDKQVMKEWVQKLEAGQPLQAE